MSDIVASENLPVHVKLGIDASIYSALKNSIYPGASDESIMMVVSYCKAAKLDPLLKPVHIVPMQVTDKSKPKEKGYHPKDWRDIVMPGIGLYRIQASRTGKYAGMTAPEFGPAITEIFTTKGYDNQEKKITVTYPEWCKLIVKKLLEDGPVVEFEVIEFWKENYASKSATDQTPNAMWARRPYAQLAKCTEAQGLRKAFPELGSQPTAEEMEGKHMIEEEGEINQINVNVAQDLQKKLTAKLSPTIEKKEPEPVVTTVNANVEDVPFEANLAVLVEKIANAKSSDELQGFLPEVNTLTNYVEKKKIMDVYKIKVVEFSKA